MSSERINGTIWGFSIGAGVMAALMFTQEGNIKVAPLFLLLAAIAAYLNYRIGTAKGETT